MDRIQELSNIYKYLYERHEEDTNAPSFYYQMFISEILDRNKQCYIFDDKISTFCSKLMKYRDLCIDDSYDVFNMMEKNSEDVSLLLFTERKFLINLILLMYQQFKQHEEDLNSLHLYKNKSTLQTKEIERLKMEIKTFKKEYKNLGRANSKLVYVNFMNNVREMNSPSHPNRIMRQNSQKSFTNINGLQLNDSIPRILETLSKSCERTVMHSHQIVAANCINFDRNKNESKDELRNRKNSAEDSKSIITAEANNSNSHRDSNDLSAKQSPKEVNTKSEGEDEVFKIDKITRLWELNFQNESGNDMNKTRSSTLKQSKNKSYLGCIKEKCNKDVSKNETSYFNQQNINCSSSKDIELFLNA